METIYQGERAPDDIARRAYELWEENGHPDGHALDFWLEAEREAATAKTAATPTCCGGNETSTPRGLELLEITRTTTAIQLAPKQQTRKNAGTKRPVVGSQKRRHLIRG